MTLYIDMAWSGPGKSEVVVVEGSNKRFGEIRVNDWIIRDGPDPSSAKVMGHAQGFHINTQPDGQSWHTSANLVFSDER